MQIRQFPVIDFKLFEHEKAPRIPVYISSGYIILVDNSAWVTGHVMSRFIAGFTRLTGTGESFDNDSESCPLHVRCLF